MMKRWGAFVILVLLVAGLGGLAAAQADDRTRVFNAPVDRVWIVTRSTLKGLGWDIDKEDRDVGWIRTDSRRLEGDNYGVYAKGTKHRLRVVIHGQSDGKTAVTIERNVFKQERILFVDKEETIPTSDHTVERQILDAIGKSL
ncbi:MAG TPA: hypothetical protein VFN71_09600 [Methylomirabilota bacterium]|nr:hypothetical protein [Methylomirabilota bacterium]